ncbi:MAG: trigger factor [Candidatus Liptonbacteria bacterium]
MTKEELEKKISGFKISHDKKSEALIEGEFSVETMHPYVQEVINQAGKDFELPGFRKGQVPENILRRNLNMAHIWSDAGHDALSDLYPEILEVFELAVISSPRVVLTKVAPENPLGFQIRVGLMPEFELPDYKKIGRKAADAKKVAEATETEIEETIAYIKKSREKDKQSAELTDENIKELGNFKDLADFRARIKENILREKDMDADRAVREEIAKNLVDATKLELPEIVIEEELRIMRKDREAELERLKISREDYLKQLQKTEEELVGQEREYVERQLKTRLILGKIADEEKIEPDEKEIEQNLEYLIKRHPESDPEQVHHYVVNMLTNELTLELLEGKTRT